MTTPAKRREVSRIIGSHRQTEGAGFIVRRPVPTVGLEAIDPFLLIDEMGPIDYAPGEAVGAPDHPHRGFETVSYIIEGELEHEDSAGHHGFLRAGDVQWMTAGAGIVHSEMPSRRVQTEGGRVHGFQIWVNLPSKLKLTRPRYQEVPSKGIPTTASADGLAKVRVVAGEALGVRAVIDTHTPIVFHDWTLSEGADVSTPISADQQVLVYVFQGEARVGDEGTVVGDGQLAVMKAGEALRLRSCPGGARLLVLGGRPHHEPIARYGPFVMNTRQQLLEAFQDFESGKMGEITRTAELR
jgi:hypothetical protein